MSAPTIRVGNGTAETHVPVVEVTQVNTIRDPRNIITPLIDRQTQALTSLPPAYDLYTFEIITEGLDATRRLVAQIADTNTVEVVIPPGPTLTETAYYNGAISGPITYRQVSPGSTQWAISLQLQNGAT